MWRKNEFRATERGYFSLVFEAEEAGTRKPVFPIHGRRNLLLRISSLCLQPRPQWQLEVRNGTPTDATTVSTTPCKRPLLQEPRELMWSRVRGWYREEGDTLGLSLASSSLITTGARAHSHYSSTSRAKATSEARTTAASDGLQIEKEKKKSSPERRVEDEAIRKSSVGPPRDFEGIGM